MPIPHAAARQILLLALGVGVLVDIVVPGNAAGINAFIVMAAGLGAAFVVVGRDGIRRIDPANSWLPVGALAFALMPAIRADDWLVQADVLLALALGAGTIACLAGARITRGLAPAVIVAAIGVLTAAVVGATSVVRSLGRRWAGSGRAHDETGTPADPASGSGFRARVPAGLVRATPVLRGLLLAIPVLALFALLFASADAVFEQLARSALDWRVDVDLGTVVERALVVSVVGWAMAGLLALAATFLPDIIPGRPIVPLPPAAPAGWGPPPGRSLGAASAADLAGGPRLGTVEATTVLALLGALFAAFVALQLAYLFGGRDTLGVVGMTYADYARRGFFELVAVAVLAGTLVVALDLVVERRSRAQLVASMVLLALTGVVLASAFVRLRLYQDAYGWTELRFVVVVAIGWLAVAIAAAAWLLVRRSTHWALHVLGVLTLVTIAGMNVIGPQSFVADRNLERAIDPSLVADGGRTGLDASYLASLGDEAVPSVVASWARLPVADRAALDGFLMGRAVGLGREPSVQGWPAWNLTRTRARDALAGWLASRQAP